MQELRSCIGGANDDNLDDHTSFIVLCVLTGCLIDHTRTFSGVFEVSMLQRSERLGVVV
jgi:hypothetical protein